jgi:hypothetical protein
LFKDPSYSEFPYIKILQWSYEDHMACNDALDRGWIDVRVKERQASSSLSKATEVTDAPASTSVGLRVNSRMVQTKVSMAIYKHTTNPSANGPALAKSSGGVCERPTNLENPRILETTQLPGSSRQNPIDLTDDGELGSGKPEPKKKHNGW